MLLKLSLHGDKLIWVRFNYYMSSNDNGNNNSNENNNNNNNTNNNNNIGLSSGRG